MSGLKGAVIAVTGAGSGIGRALAMDLVQRGAKVALADRDAEGLAETRRLIGNVPHHAAVFDVTTPGAIAQFLSDSESALGGLNGIINNAGLAVVAPFEHFPDDDFERVMDVNFRAVVSGCRAALPFLRKHAPHHGRAWLVNISSVFGMMGYPTQTAYCASKFAVRGFTETLRMELAVSDPKIEVVQVHPGGIKTNIARSAKFIRGLTDEDATLSADRFDANARTTPEQAAKTILDGMEKARTRVLIGPDARFIDWITRLLPSSYFKVIGRLLG